MTVFDYVVRTPTGTIQPGRDLDLARRRLSDALTSHSLNIGSWGSSREAMTDPDFATRVVEYARSTRMLANLARSAEPGDIFHAPPIPNTVPTMARFALEAHPVDPFDTIASDIPCLDGCSAALAADAALDDAPVLRARINAGAGGIEDAYYVWMSPSDARLILRTLVDRDLDAMDGAGALARLAGYPA